MRALRCLAPRGKSCAAALFAAGILLTACRTAKQDTDGHLDRPMVASSFEIRESRQGSRSSTRPEGRLVDYESQITVLVDRDELARTIGVTGGTDPSLGTSEVSRLDREIAELQQQLAVVDELRPVLETILEAERAAARYFERDATTERLAQEDPDWREMSEKQLEVVNQLDRLAQIHVNYSSFEGEHDWDAEPEEGSAEGERVVQANMEHDELYRRMAPPPRETGGRRTYDAAAVAEVLDQTSELLRERVAGIERAVLEKAPKATLEMEAHLVRDRPLEVTISPYTIVEGVGRGKKSSRVGLPGEEDLARVQAGYEAHAELAEALNELGDLARDDERLEQVQEQLLDTLGRAGRKLLEDLEADLDALLARQEPELADLQEQAEDIRKEVRALARAVRDLRDTAPRLAPPTLAERALEMLDLLRGNQLRGKVEELVASLGGTLEQASGELRTVLETTRADLRQSLQDLGNELAELPGASSLAQISSSLEKLHALANMRSFGDLEPTKVTGKPFSLAVAQDGSVDLADTPAEQGDQLHLKYRVVANPEAPEKEQRDYRASDLLEVRKFGWYTTFASQILFYDRLDDGSSTFRAAPGICYNLHYRPEAAETFFDVVAPGIGLSVAAPSFEDGTELAVGLQLTLLNDLLQTGYAYNISVDDDNLMFYFGLDLVQTFQTIH